MKLTKYLVEQNTHEDDEGGLVIGLRKLELGSINKMHTMTNATKVTAIELDSNFLKDLNTEILKEFTGLIVLTASTNFIQKISNLNVLVNLQELDLSTNRIRLVADMSSMTVLEYLDVSHNQIAYIEKLPDGLKVFKAGHNQLDDMGYVPSQIQVLDLKKNKIYRITELAKVAGHLHILDLEDNIINKEQLSDLFVLLEKYAKSLKQLVLAGNQVSTCNDYLIQILSRRHLQKLDHMIITPYILKAFTQIKNQKDITQVIQQTRAEYARRIKDELDAKQRILAGLRAKQEAVEELFREFRDSNAQRLLSFEDYCNKGLLKDGKDLEYQHEIVKAFENKLKLEVESNSIEARGRKRRQLEDKIQLRSNLQPQRDLYGKAGYKLPNIQQVKDNYQHTSSSNSIPQRSSESYLRIRPSIPSRPSIPYQPPNSSSSINISNPPNYESAEVISHEPSSSNVVSGKLNSKSSLQKMSSQQISNPGPSNNEISNPNISNQSLPNQAVSKPALSKPSISNSKFSKQEPSSEQIVSKQSNLSEQKSRSRPSDTSIRNTLKQKRQSINSQKKKSQKLGSDVISPEQNNDKEGIFHKDCYASFEKYFNEFE